MVEKIKEYLVSLGFKTDESGAKKAQRAMDSVQKGVQNLMAAVKALAAAGAVRQIGKFFTDMARQDLEYQKLARSMWTTRQNAEAVNRSLEVMGASLQDLWLSPELAQQFTQLRKEALEMQAPAELQGQLKEVRAMLFEVGRFRLTLQYLGQWVGYFFLTYLERPLARLKKTIQTDNDNLKKNLPETANKLGLAAAALFRLVLAGFDLVHKGWETVPKDIIAGLAAIGAAAKLLSMGPVGILIGAIVTLLALWDDYQTFLDGGVSLVPWEKFEGQIDSIQEAWDRFVNDPSWGTLQDGLDVLLGGVGQLFDTLGGWDTVTALFSGFLETVNWLVDSVGKLAEFLGKVFGWISGIVELYSQFSDFMTQYMPEGGANANLIAGTDLNSIASIVNPSGGGGGNKSQTQQNNINVYSADPARAGQAVAEELGSVAPWFDGSVTPAY